METTAPATRLMVEPRGARITTGLLAFGIVLLAWVMLEAIGAWFGLSPDIAGWATNRPAATMRHCPPNGMFCVTYRTNSQGLREPAAVGPPRSDVPRVVHVGASHTFGWGVEDDQTPPRRLQAHLSAATGREVEVINLGVPGGSVNTFLRLVNQYARALNPDIVVVDLFELRNTVYDIQGTDWATLSRDYLDSWIRTAETPDPDPESSRRQSLLWRSFAYRVSVRAWRAFAHGDDAQRPAVPWPGPKHTRTQLPDDVAGDCLTVEAPTAPLCGADYPSTLSADLRGRQVMLEFYELLKREKLIDAACRCAYSPTAIEKRILDVMIPLDGALLTERREEALAQVRLSMAALAQMQEWARGFGAQFYVAVWPNYARILRLTPQQAAERFWPSSSDVFESTRLSEAILDLCRVYDLECLNGVPAMREWAQGRDPSSVFFRDKHFTPLTSDQFGRVLAALLAPKLPVGRRLVH